MITEDCKSYTFCNTLPILPLCSGRDSSLKSQSTNEGVPSYGGDDDEYFSFISHEAFEALDEWMRYRKQCGETVRG